MPEVTDFVFDRYARGVRQRRGNNSYIAFVFGSDKCYEWSKPKHGDAQPSWSCLLPNCGS